MACKTRLTGFYTWAQGQPVLVMFLGVPMHSPLNDQALNQLFREARSYNQFSGEVSDALLHELYDMLKLGPTAANQQSARFVFVRSPEAKAKLAPALSAGNLAKTMSAPVTVICCYDLDFHEHLPQLFPHTDAKAWFDGEQAKRETPARLNATLQAAYLILAARALGLDTGPMSGFDPAKTDAAFLAEHPSWRSFMLINLGQGDPASIFPRSPRLAFDQAAEIV